MRNRKLCDGPRDSIFHQIFGSGRVTEALEGCARLFQPMYAEANMGHPSRTIDGDCEVKSAGFSLQLIWTGPKFSGTYHVLRPGSSNHRLTDQKTTINK
jgi:hypothetical protein